jgi:MerR family transcriptional regulator, heat shock protein HspR
MVGPRTTDYGQVLTFDCQLLTVLFTMAKRGRKTRSKAGYMISAVAEMYDIHPQTLRLYEREGLLIPSRSNGNTRLYTPEDLERLEAILTLTRDLGVNLAGIEIILNMRQRMQRMEEEMQAFVDFVQKELVERSKHVHEHTENALVRVAPPQIVRARGGSR